MKVKRQFSEIPTVDVAPRMHGRKGLMQVAADFKVAYGNVGFAYLVNHGIPQALIDGVFAASTRFHALDHKEKMLIEINRFHRGFIPLNTATTRSSSVDRITRPNQSESFIMMHELAADDADLLGGVDLAGPNQWPRGLPGFRQAVDEYNQAMTRFSHSLLPVIAVALGLSSDALDHYFRRPTTFLRLLYYPPRPEDEEDDVFGSAPHTDYGFFTLLAQDEVGGLQVRNVSGDWVDAPYRYGAFVMNVGDILHRLSNGQFISTPHRVINRSGHVRYSCPFFFDPDMRAEIAPLPGCIDSQQSRIYEPVVYGDYLMTRLRQNHVQHSER